MREKLMRSAGWAMLVFALAAAIETRGQQAGFQFTGALSRVFTPNGDSSKPNGNLFLCFDNPADSDVVGKITSLFAGSTATLTHGYTLAGCDAKSNYPHTFQSQYFSWDGRANGTLVHTGIYVYSISSEGHTFTGTIFVAR